MTEETTTFKELKKALLEMLKGYPDYIFWGKIEYRGIKGVDLLVDHDIIEKITEEEFDIVASKNLEKMPPKKEDILNSYRLTSKGVDLAISMINLEYAEKMKVLTTTIFFVGALTLFLTLNHLLFFIFSQLP